MAGDCLTCIYLMYEMQKKEKSFYYPYLATFPDPDNLTQWDIADVRLCQVILVIFEVLVCVCFCCFLWCMKNVGCKLDFGDKEQIGIFKGIFCILIMPCYKLTSCDIMCIGYSDCISVPSFPCVVCILIFFLWKYSIIHCLNLPGIRFRLVNNFLEYTSVVASS